MDGSVSWLLLRLMVKLAPFLSFSRLLDVAAFLPLVKRSKRNRLGTRRETPMSKVGYFSGFRGAGVSARVLRPAALIGQEHAHHEDRWRQRSRERALSVAGSDLGPVYTRWAR